MTLKTLLTINVILAVGHGAGYMFAPSLMLQIYQMPLSPSGMLMGQLFGVELLFVAIITWYGRNLVEGPFLRSIVMAGFVSDAAGTILTGKALADGALGVMGWVAFAIYGLLTLGYLYFLLQQKKAA